MASQMLLILYYISIYLLDNLLLSSGKPLILSSLFEIALVFVTSFTEIVIIWLFVVL